MTHAEKVNLFIVEMENHGIHSMYAAPPTFRWLWRLGIEVPPPSFQKFTNLAIVAALFFCCLFQSAALAIVGAIRYLDYPEYLYTF